MSFKQNLLKKIQIDRLAKSVIDSMGPSDSGVKIDKRSMKALLEMSPYVFKKERDLDLYVEDTQGEKKKILVLDNELPLYVTTIADVCLRKSPTIKEMISIKNAIKILNDKDVKISTKEATVKSIQDECIQMLDLTYSLADIEEIAHDGATSLERGYTEGVEECLTLFSELLEYVPPLKEFKISHHLIIGRLTKGAHLEWLYGPIVLYSIIHNTIKLIQEPIGTFNKQQLELYHKIASGKEKPSLEGKDVFEWLKNETMKTQKRFSRAS